MRYALKCNTHNNSKIMRYNKFYVRSPFRISRRWHLHTIRKGTFMNHIENKKKICEINENILPKRNLWYFSGLKVFHLFSKPHNMRYLHKDMSQRKKPKWKFSNMKYFWYRRSCSQYRIKIMKMSYRAFRLYNENDINLSTWYQNEW